MWGDIPIELCKLHLETNLQIIQVCDKWTYLKDTGVFSWHQGPCERRLSRPRLGGAAPGLTQVTFVSATLGIFSQLVFM